MVRLIKKGLTEVVRQKGGFPLQEFAHIVRTEFQRRQKHRRPSSKNHQYRRRCYWFKLTKSLERLKESMFQAQKAGQQDRVKELRNQYQKMVKHGKRQSFNAYLEETSESKDTRKMYDMLKRLNPRFKWRVNVGCDGEDEIARHLASLASDPVYTDLEQEFQEERQTLEAAARSENPEYFSVLDWSIVMKSLKTRKSPGPDSTKYENWRSLDPKLALFLGNRSAKL